jgi:serine/threonine-protein kinase HipA
MRRVLVLVHGVPAAVLSELDRGGGFRLGYRGDYHGPPISLTMPVRAADYEFDVFPPFFDGLLPEGTQLEALLRLAKLDAEDYLAQLLTVGADLVGAVTVVAVTVEELAEDVTP